MIINPYLLFFKNAVQMLMPRQTAESQSQMIPDHRLKTENGEAWKIGLLGTFLHFPGVF